MRERKVFIIWYLSEKPYNLRDYTKKRRGSSFYQGPLYFDSDEEHEYGEIATF